MCFREGRCNTEVKGEMQHTGDLLLKSAQELKVILCVCLCMCVLSVMLLTVLCVCDSPGSLSSAADDLRVCVCAGESVCLVPQAGVCVP